MASPRLALARSPPPKTIVVSATRRNPHCWSKLPLDLMQLVFERLSFTDFERAKSVCSSWLSGSRQSKPNNRIPWMILFPPDKNYCLLYNPEDKGKLYKTQHLGDDFAKSECLAIHKSWLLMMRYDQHMEADGFYILDLLTREIINLPTMYRLDFSILWIDEKTKDYLVIGKDGDKICCLKKGDNSWKQIPDPLLCMEKCFNMVFKDHKLYCLTYEELHIFDFSGESPLHVFKVSVRGYVREEPCGGLLIRLPGIPMKLQTVRWKDNVVVTVRGDVLIVRSENPFMSETWNFKIFKMDSSEGWEEIVSLGDEAILLDLGITVLSKDLEGVSSNSIYFNDYLHNTEIFVFNLGTKKTEQLPQVVSSSVPFSEARWFLPSFMND